jgi:hypothetical protein
VVSSTDSYQVAVVGKTAGTYGLYINKTIGGNATSFCFHQLAI